MNTCAKRKLLSLEDAVRKMTSLNADQGRPCSIAACSGRGSAPTSTVFDPETVIDQSTYLEPFQYSTGVMHVVVNGRSCSKTAP